MLIGLLALIIAGILQGLFVLPLSFTKNWKWEHNWFTFSFFGMIVLNWLIGLILFPQVIDVFRQVPVKELMLLFSFGLLWGIGAILFGLGMEKLGMSVGYPVIMGLIAGTGTLLPLILTQQTTIFTFKGMAIIGGCLLVIAGIIICAKASAKKNESSIQTKTTSIRTGLIIAVLAGLLSALPNIGMTFGAKTIDQAIQNGISPKMAGNVIWLLFFTFGFIANGSYTIYLFFKNHSTAAYFASLNGRNIFFTLLSALCWIGSFYLYGSSASMLGKFGSIVGWPLFISISIITGNMAGIWNGEWRNATVNAKQMLRYGMIIFLVALIVIGVSNVL